MSRATRDVLAKQAELQQRLPAIREALEETRAKHPVPEVPEGAVTLRSAAYVLAIERVASVALARGIWP
jgi:glutamate dehydrogenase/leucine dehydrogenase